MAPVAAAAVKYRVKGTGLYVQPPAPAQAGRKRAVSYYDAASNSPRLAKWTWTNAGPNQILGNALPALMGRSQDAVRRIGLADAAIDILTAHLVGQGIRPIWDTGDKELNREATAAFDEWVDEADADGALDFYGMQALAMRSALITGDEFLRFRPRLPEDNLSVPLQLQLLESDFCPVAKTEIGPNGRKIVQGIEFDAINARAAYWMYRSHPFDDPFGAAQLPQPIPASEIMHLSTGPMKRAGLTRGEPWLTRALIKLLDLDEWDDAHLKRQSIAQMFGGWITPAAETTFDYANVNGTPAPGADAWVDMGGTATAYIEAGGVQVLRPGESITFPNPPSPGDQYEPFSRQQIRFAAGAIGLLYEQLSGDYSGITDRTWRAGIGEFKMRLQMWRRNSILFKVCKPTIKRWGLTALLSGRFKLPRTLADNAMWRVKWAVPVMPYINPVQDVEARRNEIRSGLNSREMDAAEQGMDVYEIDEANARDRKREKEMDLTYDTDPKAVSNAGVTQARPPGSEVPNP